MAVSVIPMNEKHEITGSVGSTSGTCYYTKNGHTVTFQSTINVTNRSWTAYETVTICQLPEGYRPSNQVNFPIPTNDRAICFRGMVMPDGYVRAYNPGGAATYSILAFSMTFII